MSRDISIPCTPRRRAIRAFLRNEDGAGLVEFSIVILLFLFLLLATIDFGRLAHTWIAANKATQIAARVAAVRAPACAGVPDWHERGSAAGQPEYGTLCRAAGGTCADPGEFTCAGDPDNETASEIFTSVRPLLPAGTTIDRLRFRYTHDLNLGFLGGPYVPMVTVEIADVDFTFVSPLGPMISTLTGRASDLGANIRLPGMSVSLPGEDLANGIEG